MRYKEEKQDLTVYGDGELSLLVFNDEYLYRMRRNIVRLKNTLDELYKYSDEQLEELCNDIDDDLKEEMGE